jgi:hypothetical protein
VSENINGRIAAEVAAVAALAAVAAAANGTFVVFWSVQYFANYLTFQSTFKNVFGKKMRNAFFISVCHLQ